MSRLPREIQTPRLLLRLPAAEDAEALNGAIVASHQELSQWMDWAVEPQALEQTRKFCRESLTAWEEETALNTLMVEQTTGEIIGSSGYPRLDWTVPKFEIGYWCRTDKVGQGFVSEATWALARYAFAELAASRVEVRMDDRNRRSWSVAERLGFQLEGRLGNDVRVPDGSLRDTRIYAALTLETLKTPPAALSRERSASVYESLPPRQPGP